MKAAAKAFQELLDHYARSKNLLLVPEVGVAGKRRTVYPDGIAEGRPAAGLGFLGEQGREGYRRRDQNEPAKGYPDFNILFEG
jgi:hypothetical protein